MWSILLIIAIALLVTDSYSEPVESKNTEETIIKSVEVEVPRYDWTKERDSKFSTSLDDDLEESQSADEVLPLEEYEYGANLDILARLVEAEGGCLSDEAQIAIASVVMNRINSTEYPNSVYEVIFQIEPVQYSTAQDGKINNEPSDRARENAKRVLKDGSQIPSNVIYQSMFEQGSGIWKIIDGEYFCYE